MPSGVELIKAKQAGAFTDGIKPLQKITDTSEVRFAIPKVPSTKMKNRFPLFGRPRLTGLSAGEHIPRLHRSNAFYGVCKELEANRGHVQDESEEILDIFDESESEDIEVMESEQDNEIIPSSQLSQAEALSYSQFAAGLHQLSSQNVCTQFVQDDPKPANKDETIAAGDIMAVENIKVELEVTCDDESKVFDMVQGKFVKKSRSRMPAKNGFGESLGRYLFETKDVISPPIQVVIEGELNYIIFCAIY